MLKKVFEGVSGTYKLNRFMEKDQILWERK